MSKIQVNSQGKVYITSDGKVLLGNEGKVLTKDGNYCSSVLLRKGETAEGWSEITQDEYDEIIRQQEKSDMSE